MKKRIMISCVFLLCWCLFDFVFAQENKDLSIVTVFYFYTTVRCPSCSMIENYTKEAIESNFKEEFQSGRLRFEGINVDQKENQKYIQQYQLYTKAVILSLADHGEEIKFKNLDKIWQLARNKQAFMDYVVEEVRSLLKEDL
jgi:flagellar motor protein MotB